MRNLHFGLRVADLERSLAFYSAVGYEVVGSVPETSFGHLTMLKLPDDDFVTIELVHDPTKGEVDLGARLSHFVRWSRSTPPSPSSPPRASMPTRRDHRMAQTTFERHGSPTRTATASSWSSGRPITRTASPRPTGPD
jgi:catechol 2,3-dioxygenase-like lactoylglutathione lyase family enzyme